MYTLLWKSTGDFEWYAEGSFETLQEARDYFVDSGIENRCSEALFLLVHLDETISVVQEDEDE